MVALGGGGGVRREENFDFFRSMLLNCLTFLLVFLQLLNGTKFE